MQREKTVYSVADVCKKYNFSRNVVERYLKAELIEVTGKGKRKERLFDEETVKKIGFLRFLQSFDITIPTIKIILNSPTRDIKKILSDKANGLRDQIEVMTEYLSIIEELLDAKTIKNLISIYNDKTGDNKWKR